MLVYLVMFPNKKIYVGATTRSLAKRKAEHLLAMRSGVDNKFHRALAKYGVEGTSWRVMSSHSNAATMFDAERALIASLNCVADGYNTTTGGEGCPGRAIDEAERIKIADGQRRRFESADARVATSQAVKRWYAENPEAAARSLVRRLDTLRSPQYRAAAALRAKKVFQENPEIARRAGAALSQRMAVDDQLRMRLSAANGGSPILMSKDGVVLQRFVSLSEAARVMNMSLGNVGSVVRGKRNHSGGYQFKRERSDS